MPFKTVRGLKGKVYVPDTAEKGTRRHACIDCYSCQLCSDNRCRVCRDDQSACTHDELDQP